MKKILFVCHGNICRSPMAEFLMRAKVEAAGLSDRIVVASAATSSEELGNPVYPPVKRLLKAHGIDCSGKTARRLTLADYANFDWLVGMDSWNLNNMKQLYRNESCDKIKLLLDFTDAPGDVDDPWYHRDFKRTWGLVNKGCDALLAFLIESDPDLQVGRARN